MQSKVNTAPDRDHPTPMMLINDCSRVFGHRMRKFGDESGVPAGYRALLMHLAFAADRGEETPTQYELARHTHLSAPTVSVTLQKMEQSGYITRVTDPSDLRQIQVALTDKGMAVNTANQKQARAFEAVALEGLSEHEISELRRLLSTIYANLTRGTCYASQELPERKD